MPSNARAERGDTIEHITDAVTSLPLRARLEAAAYTPWAVREGADDY